MFITKKRHDRIVADLKASLKNSEDWVEEMRKQRDAAQNLKVVLVTLADKAQKFDTFASGSLNFSGELIMPDNVPVYVDDYFGGKVIKQEAVKVIQISTSGEVKTGLTRRKPGENLGYILVQDGFTKGTK
jgi:hypothetical protein